MQNLGDPFFGRVEGLTALAPVVSRQSRSRSAIAEVRSRGEGGRDVDGMPGRWSRGGGKWPNSICVPLRPSLPSEHPTAPPLPPSTLPPNPLPPAPRPPTMLQLTSLLLALSALCLPPCHTFAPSPPRALLARPATRLLMAEDVEALLAAARKLREESSELETKMGKTPAAAEVVKASSKALSMPEALALLEGADTSSRAALAALPLTSFDNPPKSTMGLKPFNVNLQGLESRTGGKVTGDNLVRKRARKKPREGGGGRRGRPPAQHPTPPCGRRGCPRCSSCTTSLLRCPPPNPPPPPRPPRRTSTARRTTRT
jgi:hypothetical protein